jgi:hypothetical protein
MRKKMPIEIKKQLEDFLRGFSARGKWGVVVIDGTVNTPLGKTWEEFEADGWKHIERMQSKSHNKKHDTSST